MVKINLKDYLLYDEIVNKKVNIDEYCEKHNTTPPMVNRSINKVERIFGIDSPLWKCILVAFNHDGEDNTVEAIKYRNMLVDEGIHDIYDYTIWRIKQEISLNKRLSDFTT